MTCSFFFAVRIAYVPKLRDPEMRPKYGRVCNSGADLVSYILDGLSNVMESRLLYAIFFSPCCIEIRLK